MDSVDYKTILNKLPIIIYVNDATGINVVFYNEAWYNYTGMTPESMNAGWSHIVHPDDLVNTIHKMQESIANKQSYELEVRLLNNHTKEYRWFLSRAHPLINENGEVYMWIGTSVDINDSKQSLQEMSKRYQTSIQGRMARIKELEAELEIHKSQT